MHLRILLCRCSNIQLLRTCFWSPTLLTSFIYTLAISVLFLRVKMQLWGHCLQDVPEIHNNRWSSNMIFQKFGFGSSWNAQPITQTWKETTLTGTTMTNYTDKHTFCYQLIHSRFPPWWMTWLSPKHRNLTKHNILMSLATTTFANRCQHTEYLLQHA